MVRETRGCEERVGELTRGYDAGEHRSGVSDAPATWEHRVHPHPERAVGGEDDRAVFVKRTALGHTGAPCVDPLSEHGNAAVPKIEYSETPVRRRLHSRDMPHLGGSLPFRRDPTIERTVRPELPDATSAVVHVHGPAHIYSKSEDIVHEILHRPVRCAVPRDLPWNQRVRHDGQEVFDHHGIAQCVAVDGFGRRGFRAGGNGQEDRDGSRRTVCSLQAHRLPSPTRLSRRASRGTRRMR